MSVAPETDAADPGHAAGAASDTQAHGPTAAAFDPPYEPPVRRQSERFEDWRERAESAQAAREQVEDFERRWERRNSEPTEQAVDDLTDIGHYEDGLEAATGADMTTKGEWLAEHLEFVERAYNYATCRLAGGCGEEEERAEDDGDAEDETTIDPSEDTNVPANRGKQRGKLGLQADRTG